jgi:hypothetical protein
MLDYLFLDIIDLGRIFGQRYNRNLIQNCDKIYLLFFFQLLQISRNIFLSGDLLFLLYFLNDPNLSFNNFNPILNSIVSLDIRLSETQF